MIFQDPMTALNPIMSVGDQIVEVLLSAIPVVDIHKPMARIPMKGEITSPINPKPGCRFASRCPYTTEACRQPQKLEEVSPTHFVSCCRVRELG